MANDLPPSKPVSTGDLMGLTILQLRALSREQLRGRSKLKSKRALIQALKGVLTSIDLDPLIPLEIHGKHPNWNERKNTKYDKPKDPTSDTGYTSVELQMLIVPFRWEKGNRINGKVMGIDVHLETLAYCLINNASISAEGQFTQHKRGNCASDCIMSIICSDFCRHGKYRRNIGGNCIGR